MAAASTSRGSRVLRALAAGLLVALLLLCLAWELWLAPLRPGGSYLALKALPLVLPLSGILRDERRTYQWSSMLILAWVAEGATRAWADKGTAQTLAAVEFFLGLAFFATAVSYARATQTRRDP